MTDDWPEFQKNVVQNHDKRNPPSAALLSNFSLPILA